MKFLEFHGQLKQLYELNVAILHLLVNRFENFFDRQIQNDPNKFKIVNYNSFNKTCKNKRVTSTHSFNFTGPLYFMRSVFFQIVSLLAPLESLENIELISLFLMLRNIKYYNLWFTKWQCFKEGYNGMFP